MATISQSAKKSGIKETPGLPFTDLAFSDQALPQTRSTKWAYKLAAAQDAGHKRAASKVVPAENATFDDKTILPPNEALTITRRSYVREREVTFIQPISVEALTQLHNLPHVRFKAIDYVPSQIKFISYFCSCAHNILLEAKTGCGKTFISLMCADKYLADPANKVIAVTPSIHLVDQFERDATTVLTLPHDDAVMKATGDSSPTERAERYRNAATRLIVGTAETVLNDLLSGALPLEAVKLIIFDEMHLITGDHAMARLAALVGELNRTLYVDRPIRELFQSATPGNSRKEIEARMELIGATDYVPLDISPNNCFSTIRLVKLDGVLLETHRALKDLGRSVLRELWVGLLTVADSYAAAAMPYSRIEDLMIAIGSAFSKGGKRSLARFLTARRDLFKSEAGISGVSYQLKERKREFVMASSGKLGETLKFFDDTMQRTDEWPLRAPRSLMSQLGHLRDIANVVQTQGLCVFLFRAAHRYSRSCFEDTRSIAPDWLMSLYRLPAMQALLRNASQNTPFQDFFESTSWKEFFEKACLGSTEEFGTHKELMRALGRYTLPLMATRSERDHPAETELLHWLTGDTRVNGGDGVQIRIKQAAHAHFLKLRLRYLLSLKDAPYRCSLLASKKHLPGKQRVLNLTQYEKRETQALLATSAGDLGVDCKRTKAMLCLATPPTLIGEEQKMGRSGRREKLNIRSKEMTGISVIIATEGSEDEFRAYACRHQLEKARRERALVGELEGGVL